MQQISRWFTQGVLVLVPIVVTVLIVRWLVRVLDGLTAFVGLPLGLKVALVLVLVVLVGWAAGFWGTRWILRYGESFLQRIPMVRTVYGSVKQMSEALADPGRFLGRPVLVPVGGGDTRVLGFFVGEVRVPHDSEPWACVFVPMSLNLTGGFNLFVPAARVVDVEEVDREAAFRFVLTAGASMPSGMRRETASG